MKKHLWGFSLAMIGVFLNAAVVTAFEIKSSSFENGQRIPALYTCSGKDMSPPLTWADVPQGTKSLLLICDDPDAPAGTWVHWVIYAIPPETKGFEENVPPRKTLSNHSMQGRNDFQRIGYGGPCPPPGLPHRYFFKLYALDATLEAEPGLTKSQVLKAMEGHILGKTELMGKFGR